MGAELGKPVNRYALAFKILGVFFFLARIADLFVAARSLALSGVSTQQLLSETRVFDVTVVAVAVGAPFFGLGVIIEILDQIRWNQLPADQRETTSGKRRKLLWYLRRWPHEAVD